MSKCSVEVREIPVRHGTKGPGSYKGQGMAAAGNKLRKVLNLEERVNGSDEEKEPEEPTPTPKPVNSDSPRAFTLVTEMDNQEAISFMNRFENDSIRIKPEFIAHRKRYDSAKVKALESYGYDAKTALRSLPKDIQRVVMNQLKASSFIYWRIQVVVTTPGGDVIRSKMRNSLEKYLNSNMSLKTSNGSKSSDEA